MRVEICYSPSLNDLTLKIPSSLDDSLLPITLETTLDFSSHDRHRYSLSTKNYSSQEFYEIVRQVIDLIASEKLKFVANDDAITLINKASSDQKYRMQIIKNASDLLNIKHSPRSDLKATKFIRTLKEYQEEPVSLMVKVPYAANFSVPGSGKTTMLYAAYSLLESDDKIDKLFIIAPSAAYIAWTEEYEKCFNTKPLIIRITGPKSSRIRLYNRPEKYNIFITTYQTAAADVAEISALLRSGKFLLVLDESHNIKRFAGGIWSSAVCQLGLFAERRIILTGTPLPNSLLDLWSQFYFLDRTIAGTRSQFVNITKRKDAEELIRKKLMPFYRRVKKSQLHLPNPIFNQVIVKSSTLQQRIYASIKRASIEEFNIAKKDRSILVELRRSIMIRLMQAASNPSLLYEKSIEFNISGIKADKMSKYLEPSVIEGIKNYSKYEIPPKLKECDKLARQILNISKSKKVVIWSVWINNIKTLRSMFKDYDPQVIYGDIPINDQLDKNDNREIRIKKFKSDPNCRVLIANPGACGESISLHDVCHDAIYLDRTFNAGQYMQSLDRIHRVGLNSSTKTNYYLLQTESTIDETVNRRLIEKCQRMAKILNDDFKVLNLETKLDEVSDDKVEFSRDFEQTIKDINI